MPTISTRSGLGCSCDDLRGLGADCGNQPSTGDVAAYQNWIQCIDNNAGNASANASYVPQAVVNTTCPTGFHWNGIAGLLASGLGACVKDVVNDPAVYGPVNGVMVTHSVWQKWQTDQTAIQEAQEAKAAAEYAKTNALAAQYAQDQAMRAQQAKVAAAAVDALAASTSSSLASDTAFVTGLYSSILHRAPDASGLAYWVSQLQNGASRDMVQQSIQASPEEIASLVGSNTTGQMTTTTAPLSTSFDWKTYFFTGNVFGIPEWMITVGVGLGVTLVLYEATKK